MLVYAPGYPRTVRTDRHALESTIAKYPLESTTGFPARRTLALLPRCQSAVQGC